MNVNSSRIHRVHDVPIFALLAGVALIALPSLGQPFYEDHKLLASDGVAGDEYGYAVAIGDGVVVVGSHKHDDYGDSSGSAYLFNASSGAQIAKLLPDDLFPLAYFGESVAIGNGVVAVGALGDDSLGWGTGTVYLFSTTTGELITKLYASDGDSHDYFGSALAIGGGIIAVGAISDGPVAGGSIFFGSVYLFDVDTGAEIAKIMLSDGAEGDHFGYSIAVDDGIVAIGGPWVDANGIDSGVAYLFSATTGTQIAKLLPAVVQAGDSFGYSVDIEDGIVAVGSPSSLKDGIETGSAYLFRASTGAKLGKLVPFDRTEGGAFGETIEIESGLVAVGAIMHNPVGITPSSGAVYLFDVSSRAPIGKLLPRTGYAYGYFGDSLDSARGVFAVGATGNSETGGSGGAAYVFAVPGIGCGADLNGDGFVDAGDIAEFVTLFLAFDASADLNGDGFVDVGDIGEFVELFLAGC